MSEEHDNLMSELPAGVSASDAPMNETRARVIMADILRESDGALKSVRYIDWNPGDKSITMDDNFKIEELEAILWWVKNYKECIK
jgi:hypothetical protein